MITFENVSVRMAGRLLLEEASVSLPPFAKVGFLGRNGTGKTTLFKAICDEFPTETGRIDMPPRIKIGRVAQEAPSTDESLIDIVLKADAERTELLSALEQTDDTADIHMRLHAIDAGTATARASLVLKGLGFDEEAQARAAREFSGGWRMRVALAAILFSNPDLLLLDEPTNYLDLEGTSWLIEHLKAARQTALIISHDREVLNAVCDHILHLENQKLTLWKGNYESFRKQKSDSLMIAEKAAKKQADRKAELQAFVDRFKATASKAAQAQSRMKMIEKMGSEAVVFKDAPALFSIPNPVKKASPPILTLEQASTGYEEGKPILNRLNLRIDNDDRIALLGANGKGKSTFLKLISGRLPLFSGQMVKMSGLKIAYFAQHQLDELRPEESAYEHVRRLMPQEPEAKVRGRVARFGFSGDRADTVVKSLSGGEKARLLLGLATFEGPHLLILDEPTNHLDIEARQALVESLNAYEGAVMIVAHDKYLLESVVDRLWIAGDGTIQPYAGDLEEYTRAMSGKDKASPKGKGKSGDKPAKPSKTLAELDEKIAALNTQLDKIDRILAQPGFYEKFPENAATAAKAREKAEKQLEKLEEEWLELAN
jgi:ATP-binding cassette, subfamily F, member 3